jgi:hypothetical protein
VAKAPAPATAIGGRAVAAASVLLEQALPDVAGMTFTSAVVDFPPGALAGADQSDAEPVTDGPHPSPVDPGLR